MVRTDGETRNSLVPGALAALLHSAEGKRIRVDGVSRPHAREHVDLSVDAFRCLVQQTGSEKAKA